MKKTIFLMLAFVLCLSMCACGTSSNNTLMNTEPVAPTTEPSLVEKMEQAESIEELKTYFVFGKSTKEETAAYYRKRNEFFLAQMSGYYYNCVPLSNSVNSYIKMGKIHKLEDNRAVYYVSRDEIYFMPYSEQEMAGMGLTLEDIPNMENAEVYRYAVDEQYGNSGSMTFHSCYLDESAYEDYRSLEIYYDSDDGSIRVHGFFPDETSEPNQHTKENTISYFGGRDYYLSIDAALEAKAEAEGRTADGSDYSAPKEGQSFSDYVKEQDPDLYDAITDNYNSAVGNNSNSSNNYDYDKGYGYSAPKEGQSFSDYVKEQDPELYDSLFG